MAARWTAQFLASIGSHRLFALFHPIAMHGLLRCAGSWEPPPCPDRGGVLRRGGVPDGGVGAAPAIRRLSGGRRYAHLDVTAASHPVSADPGFRPGFPAVPGG